MKVGYLVKSLRGHDIGRIYMVAAVLNDNFVLLVDGKYRLIENPKQKRIKHLSIVSDSEKDISELSDSAISKIIKEIE